jgi:hypothetical protein
MKALFGANRFLELALLAALSWLGNLRLNKSLNAHVPQDNGTYEANEKQDLSTS